MICQKREDAWTRPGGDEHQGTIRRPLTQRKRKNVKKKTNQGGLMTLFLMNFVNSQNGFLHF